MELPYQPTPIGAGALYHPTARPALVQRGAPVRGLRCGTGVGARWGAHIELFVRGRAVVVPAGIGIAGTPRREGAYVHGRTCTYPVRSHAPGGVLELRRGSRLTLGDVFAVWGQPLSRTRLVGFTTSASRPVRAYVGGRRWRGDVRGIRVRRHAQIVLELGAYIPPHPFFLFRPGL